MNFEKETKTKKKKLNLTVNYRKTENWRGRYYCVDGYTEFHSKFLTKRKKNFVSAWLLYKIWDACWREEHSVFRVFLCQFVEHKKLLVWKMFHSNLIRLVSFEEVFATLGIEFKMCKHENGRKCKIYIRLKLSNDWYYVVFEFKFSVVIRMSRSRWVLRYRRDRFWVHFYWKCSLMTLAIC